MRKNYNLFQSNQLGDVLALALQYRDDYTYWHSDRVISITIELSEALSLTMKEIRLLTVSAAFHDVGKIGIPDSILKKPGKLNQTEWSIMKTHSEISSEIVKRADSRDAAKVANILLHHHEHFDGRGYPDGLTGDKIPFMSRIIAIADSYDAMTSARSYRSSMNHKKTTGTMSKEHEKFDPELLSVFFKMIEHSPHRVE